LNVVEKSRIIARGVVELITPETPNCVPSVFTFDDLNNETVPTHPAGNTIDALTTASNTINLCPNGTPVTNDEKFAGVVPGDK
jgi:hypothetical protein